MVMVMVIVIGDVDHNGDGDGDHMGDGKQATNVSKKKNLASVQGVPSNTVRPCLSCLK